MLVAGCRAPEPGAGGDETQAAARSVSDAACASCHADIYESYKQTGMGRSVSVFDAETAPESFADARVFNTASGTYYEAFVRGDSLYQRAWREDADGGRYAEREYPVALVVGSGNATRSYFMRVNDRYTEMPLTWYVDRRMWDVSPAYEQFDEGFSRPITLECMTCHNGVPDYTPFTGNHYTNVPTGIGCERCHGPGGEHVDRALAGLVEDHDTTIVNPAALDRDTQLSVCQQCHLTGISVFEPGEDPTTFAPGRPLTAHRSVYVEVAEANPDAVFGIASHGVRLAQSACFLQSSMTCTTCHDPHVPVATLGADWFNTRCQSCHTPEAASTLCSRPVSTPDERLGGDCSGCHMPKGGTSDIPHVTFTDHWIRPVRTGAPPAGPIDFSRVHASPLKLVRVATSEAVAESEAQSLLSEAVAYMEFYDTFHRLPAYLDSVIAMAGQANAGGADGLNLRLAVGRAHLERGDYRTAADVLGAAADAYPDDATLAYWASVAHQRAGEIGEAVVAIERAVALQPLFADAQMKRGDLLAAQGDIAGATSAYRRVIELDPVHLPAAWNNLGFLYLQQNALAEGLEYIEEGLRLDPQSTAALVNGATAHMMTNDWASAEKLLLRALDIDDTLTGVYGNLGILYLETDRPARARAMFERLLELDPTDARARMMVLQMNQE